MLDREICAACRAELMGAGHSDLFNGLSLRWRCPAKAKTHKDSRIEITDKIPAGCLRLFEYAVLKGTEDVK